MKKIIIQAGHENIKSNCVTSLRSSTGAGGEVEVNVAVANATADLLRLSGVEVKRVDANYNCDPTSLDTDWDLFLSVHCDMDYANDNGSGFCDYPEPSTDGVTKESQRLAKEIQDYFFPALGINIKSRSNANTRYYYMWKSLSSKTPCVLIEMGQVKDPHDSVILKNTSKVATALSDGILKAFGIKPLSWLDEDIPSDVEEKYKLKEIERYSKYWTYNELISDWVKLVGEYNYEKTEKEKYKKEARELRETTKSQAETIAKANEEVKSLSKANAGYRSEIAQLQAQFATVSSERDSLEGIVKDYHNAISKLREENNELIKKIASQNPLKKYSVKDLIVEIIDRVFKGDR